MPEGMKPPEKIVPKTLGDYLDVMSKSVFQSGMSWKVIEAKWSGTREAFMGFDVDRVANMTPSELDAIASDSRIIRNRKKVEAVVSNARTMREIAPDAKGFQAFLRSHGSYDATAAALKKRFKFLGDTGCYHFLYVVSEEVPPPEQYMAEHGIKPPRG